MDATTVENIAKVAHEANRAYCATIGDTSHQAWEAMQEWQREPIRNGVRFALEHPGVSPAESHANWLADKRANGWKFGPVKDLGTKEHPCCLPYEELPDDQKRKDALFLGVVRAMAPALVVVATPAPAPASAAETTDDKPAKKSKHKAEGK